ncbi:nucleoside monophosphate kinase [Candidatus Woesearchaeota archaeon]|nr:nucleoside monophosphate kinase [Candidatus Woesearchaeota archaeon]
MYKTVTLIGPPGAGKTTAGRRLAEDLPAWCFYAASGDMVRVIMQQDSALAEQIKQLTSQGKLTPDNLICRMLEDYLAQMNCCALGLILDGTPRTLSQTKMLQNTLNFVEVYHCDLSDEAARDRILVTRAAELRAAGKPPRLDDSPDAVMSRLQEYHSLTEPTLDFFRQNNVPITKFDMDASKDDVYFAIRNHFVHTTIDRLIYKR